MKETLAADLKANGGGALTLWRGARHFLIHPGFAALCCYRLYSKLYPQGGAKRWIARMLWLRNVRKTGCYISPYCDIGPGLTLKHATGIVIGDGVKIGANVSIYQNVTLGLRNETGAQYPSIENDAILYAGACILGGITIGKGAVIGANAVVLENIPERTQAAGAPAKIITPKKQKRKAA